MSRLDDRRVDSTPILERNYMGGEIRCCVTSSRLGEEEGGSTLANKKIDDLYLVFVTSAARYS